MKYTINNDYIEKCNQSTKAIFPKYTSQLINWANQNAQGTRPAVVGQMSELFPEFMAQQEDITIENWCRWYTDRYPEAITVATDKIYSQIENLKKAIELIDRSMVEQWVQDLIISKTFNGLYIQKAILASLAQRKNTDYRLAYKDEESIGIDGYVGNIPYSIKPETYKAMQRLSEEINVKMIYYTKKKDKIEIEAED